MKSVTEELKESDKVFESIKAKIELNKAKRKEIKKIFKFKRKLHLFLSFTICFIYYFDRL